MSRPRRRETEQFIAGSVRLLGGETSLLVITTGRLGVTCCGPAATVSSVRVDPFARHRLGNEYIRVPEFGVKVDPEFTIGVADIGEVQRAGTSRFRAARRLMPGAQLSAPVRSVRNQAKKRQPSEYDHE